MCGLCGAVGARFNLRPCLHGAVSQGNPPSLGFEPEVCSVGFVLGK